LHLEHVTVGGNVIEGIIAIGAGLASGSVALLGFGIDAFVESRVGFGPHLAGPRRALRDRE
jgi:hypothetical protein